MRIAIFGGTGSLGWLAVRQAVDEGYGCKVLTRRADKMPEVPGVEFVQGDISDGGKVMFTLTGCDAVLVSVRPTTRGQKALLPAATSLIVAGMQKLELSRILTVSALGVGDSLRQLPIPARLAAMSLHRARLREKEEQERIVRGSGLSWTIVRPARFVEGSATGRYSVDQRGTAGAKHITREDAAEFVIRELAEGEYLQQTIALVGA